MKVVEDLFGPLTLQKCQFEPLGISSGFCVWLPEYQETEAFWQRFFWAMSENGDYEEVTETETSGVPGLLKFLNKTCFFLSLVFFYNWEELMEIFLFQHFPPPAQKSAFGVFSGT